MFNVQRSTFAIIPTALLALGAVEGIAWWWMHPAVVRDNQPVLSYRPSRSAGVSPADHRPPITDHFSTATITPLPEVYQKAAPMLRCSSGQVFHLQIDDSAGLHGAFFEWDGTDTGSVLEAFRHMPEACMGSIGMKLVSREKPIPYTVDGQTLLFDHTVFRDPGQGGGPLAPDPLVHAFRAVWVAGMSSADAREGLDGRKFDQLRAIRLKAALTRFRPTHARVIQGAVRGLNTPQSAWQAFEQNMLRHLVFER